MLRYQPRWLTLWARPTCTFGTEIGTTEICGIGAADPDGVRFQEKDVPHDGKDPRLAHTARDGRFIAATGL
ncbi:MAG: hypothetical protein JWN47_3197 [Frankiales bacterium]|nr:hypothetical protein [Frankiales bacterium]